MQLMRRRGWSRAISSVVVRCLSCKVDQSHPLRAAGYGDVLWPSSWISKQNLQYRKSLLPESSPIVSRSPDAIFSLELSGPPAHMFDGGNVERCGLRLETGEISTAIRICEVSHKLKNFGVVSKCGLKGYIIMGSSPFGFGSAPRRMHCLHAEVKAEDDKHEKVAAFRGIEATVRKKPSRTKRGAETVRRVGCIPFANVVDLKPTSQVSIAERDRELRRKEAETGVDVTKEKKRVRSISVTRDDKEEICKPLLTPVNGVQKLKQSDRTYKLDNLTGKDEAMALLRAALDEAADEENKVEEEFQRSLKVGIVGAPNAGKSLLTNQLVGTRVSAVSRKTNTTHREHLGVFTQGDTQLLYYDTPGLHLDIEGSPLRVEAQHRVQNAWQIVDFCEALVVIVDAERQIRRPDKRVTRLVEKLGREQMVSQKRVLCLNKVDIIEQKRTLLPLAKEFEDLPGYSRIFMISGLTGSGVKDVQDYLLDQAVLRPWDEDPENTDHRDIALEVVREQVFDLLHEELPHTTKQKLVSWKVLTDGSVRIQQLLLVPKKEHQKILVGKKGAVIGEIGIKARKELQSILGVTVHLVLDVKVSDDN